VASTGPLKLRIAVMPTVAGGGGRPLLDQDLCAALILARQPGAVHADILDKPVAAAGLALSR
jgi:hypothetical protein